MCGLVSVCLCVWVNLRACARVCVCAYVGECECVGPAVPNCKQLTCGKCCVAGYDMVLRNGACCYGRELQ